MIVRIVKMTFMPDKTEEFLANFEKHKEQIRNFSGCRKLSLLQENHQSNVYFTYSWWESENDLENYRQSELFKGVWQQTKKYFADRPMAWSLVNKVEL